MPQVLANGPYKVPRGVVQLKRGAIPAFLSTCTTKLNRILVDLVFNARF